MAHFYGTVQGSRGEASRLGGEESGMTTFCASYKGAVRCRAYVSPTGHDIVRVERVTWLGEGVNELLYEGPIGCYEE